MELDDDVKANAMRHMMPKEILNARQRADVHVGDVLSVDKESWHGHATSEHKHDHSNCREDHNSSSNG